MNLRCRGPTGQHTLAGVDSSISIRAFQELLQEKTGVAPARQEVLAGFPPKPIQLPTDRSQPLASLPIANGDTIVVRESDVVLPAEAAEPTPDVSALSEDEQLARAIAESMLGPGGADRGAGAPSTSERLSDDMSEDEMLARAIAASMAETAPPPSSSAAGPIPAPTPTPSQPGPSPSAPPLSLMGARQAAADAAAARFAAQPPTARPNPAPAAVSAAPARGSPSRPAPKRALPAAAAALPSSRAGPSRPAVPPTTTPLPQGAPTSLQLPDGSLVVRRIIESDNSCLFNAVGYVMERSRKHAPALRQIIAEVVAADPETYSEAYLGKTNPEYCHWILNPQKWGGAIELAILSQHYGREIAAYDIQTQRCDVYGQGCGYSERVMLIYDGLHYDALAVQAFSDAPEEVDLTVFTMGGPSSLMIFDGAAELVAKCHAARQFTDTASFTLRCGVCQIGVKGEKEAVEHARATGHQSFSEYH